MVFSVGYPIDLSCHTGLYQSQTSCVTMYNHLPYLALPADVPHVELEALRLDRLDVEALRRRDVLRLLRGQLLQQRRLP